MGGTWWKERTRGRGRGRGEGEGEGGYQLLADSPDTLF